MVLMAVVRWFVAESRSGRFCISIIALHRDIHAFCHSCSVTFSHDEDLPQSQNLQLNFLKIQQMRTKIHTHSRKK